MEKIIVPNLYYWETEYNGKAYLMTAAFQWKGMNYGFSFSMEDNAVKNKMNKKKLINIVKESLDILVHHGKNAIVSDGNINSRETRDEEARRFWLDKLWAKRIICFNKIVKVKNITCDEAKKLKLL